MTSTPYSKREVQEFLGMPLENNGYSKKRALRAGVGIMH